MGFPKSLTLKSNVQTPKENHNHNTRRLTTDPRPYWKTYIQGKEFEALIDTGAVTTIIGDEVAAHLRKMGIRPIRVDYYVKTATGGIIPAEDQYTFDMQLNRGLYKITAHHLPQLNYELILGIDLIVQLNLVTINIREEDGLRRKSNPKENVISAVSLLTEREEEILDEFLAEELKKFDQVKGITNLEEHTIKLLNKVPIKQRHYPRNPAMQKVIDDEVDRMLQEGIIEHSKSPWSSPIVLVKKSSGRFRFCIDFRKVNEVSEKDAYPLPQINSILDKLRDARYITTLDLAQGYWQVPLEKESKQVTAFTVPGKGHYHFKVMPFGLHSAGATFQRLMDKIIGPRLEPYAFAYLDDLVIVSKTFNEHLEILRTVFDKLREAGLKLNPDKCQFCRRELKYLGHIINEDGIQTDPEKVETIRQFPRPENVKTLRSFLGLASWYRKFVQGFSKTVVPLTKLLRKKQSWQWTVEQEQAFNELKDKLTNTPALACPNFNIPFVIQVDASYNGIGAALTQKEDGKEKAIAYASRLLSESEKKYTVTEKECLALVWAIKKFRPYIEGYKFLAITDHQALRWLMNIQQPSGRLARWALEIQQHDFDVVYRKGTLNKVADALSRYPVKEIVEINSMEKVEEHIDTPKDKKPPCPKGWYENTFQKVSKRPQKFQDFVVKDGKLYKKIEYTHSSDKTLNWKLCVPINLRESVLAETHDAHTAGHLGIRKTLRRVKDRYYWPGLNHYVKEYVRKCKTCQSYKVEQAKAMGKMYFRKPKGPWYTVTVDLIGPLPRSKRGNKYILVVQDTFTKWIELAPLRDATARLVAAQFNELILCRYGAPEVAITDNGTQFTSKLWSQLLKGWGIEHSLTPPYSPQANSVERANRVLKTMMSQYVKEDHRTWDQYLYEFRYAMNTATHDSTGYTPAMLNFGRELRIPNALHGPLRELNANEGEEEGTKSSHIGRMDHFKILYKRCQENLKSAFTRQSKYYNLRRRNSPFAVGDKVWRRTHYLSTAVDSFASKLAPKFDGPFYVMNKFGPNVYELRTEKDESIGKVHAKDLKFYK